MKTTLQTGQRTCHDAQGAVIACAGSGQDAEYASGLAWPVPRFRASGAVALDRLTMLTWTLNAAPAQFPLSWDEAFEFVARLNQEGHGGFDDWRLPNRRELRSLISYQTRRPALPEGHSFDQVFCGWYWTSTTAAISPAHAWYVDLDGGRMFFGGKDQSYMVWPVRGSSAVLARTGQRDCYDNLGLRLGCPGSGQDGETRLGSAWPNPRFVVQGSGVLDRLTGLSWSRVAHLQEGAMYWDEAMAEVARQRSQGRLLRLPNINELESLVDCGQHSPALPEGHPFDALEDVYWSATTSLYETDWAWALYLDKGATGVGLKRHARFHVWLIHDDDVGGNAVKA